MWHGYVPFRPADRGSVPFHPRDPAVWAFAQRNIERSPGFLRTRRGSHRMGGSPIVSALDASWCHHLNAEDVAALIATDRLWDFTRTWTPDQKWQPREPAYAPTPEEVNVWSISSMGHDSYNCWVCVKAECERLGVPHICEHCQGEGSLWTTPEAKAAAEVSRQNNDLRSNTRGRMSHPVNMHLSSREYSPIHPESRAVTGSNIQDLRDRLLEAMPVPPRVIKRVDRHLDLLRRESIRCRGAAIIPSKTRKLAT